MLAPMQVHRLSPARASLKRPQAPAIAARTMIPAIIHCDEEEDFCCGCMVAYLAEVAMREAPQCLQTEAPLTLACVQAGQ